MNAVKKFVTKSTVVIVEAPEGITEYQIAESELDGSLLAEDENLEKRARGCDAKGNVRYFCPKCHVRYIGKIDNDAISIVFRFDLTLINTLYFDTELKYLKTHLKECGIIHECSYCHQKFKQKRTFTAHIKKKHPGPEYWNFASITKYDILKQTWWHLKFQIKFNKKQHAISSF